MGTQLGHSGSPQEELDAVLQGRATAVRAGLDGLLRPRSIAVVGASSDPRTIAGMLFGNLMASPFTGPVLPVNSSHSSVQGVPAFPDLTSCPVVPDLVVVCVPARAVPDVVTEAGALGVAAACVISAGFAETGPEGAALEREVLARAAVHGMRILGPNCTGVLGGSGDTRFNATFGRVVPQAGGTVLLSQSGALGLAVLEAAQDRGLGVGGFVSVGNCADVSAADLLQYWGQDPAVDLVLLYLESVPDARSLVPIAQQVSSRIPIVAVKAGRSEAGSRAAASHTAALASGDTVVSALLEQAGIIRADSIAEMLDLASVLRSHRTFRGRRVAVVTNGGGPGILAADACELNGLMVPPLDEATAARLRPLFPREASLGNPVDMIASADADQYGRAVRVLADDADIDAQLVVFNTPLLTSSEEVAAELVACRPALPSDQPMLAVFMNRDGPPAMLRTAGIPSFVYPENAARALARCIGWASRRERGTGAVCRPDVDAGRVTALLTSVEPNDDGWLTTRDAQELIGEYGIAVSPFSARGDPGGGRGRPGRARRARGGEGRRRDPQERRRRGPGRDHHTGRGSRRRTAHPGRPRRRGDAGRGGRLPRPGAGRGPGDDRGSPSGPRGRAPRPGRCRRRARGAPG